MTSVTLPSLIDQTKGENHLRNLTYIVRKPKGANAPPKASRLTRERFSIILADKEAAGISDFSVGVSGKQQQNSQEDIRRVDDSMDYASSSANILGQQNSKGSLHEIDEDKSNSMFSISILKIKGFSSSLPLQEEQIDTVKNLFDSSIGQQSLANGNIDIDDEIWNDFNDSQKLKNNLELLLTCKKMNLHFEVARHQNIPGMVVVPMFHCQRCFELWKNDMQMPESCDLPSNPIRGAPIALDQRAQVFLKDQSNITYIEVQGSQTTLNKKFQNMRTFSSMKKIASHLNGGNYKSQNDGGGDQSNNSGHCLKANNQHRPKSQASAIAIRGDEKSPQPAKSGDSFAGITKINIKNGEAGGEGIRMYGGLTNSQARVFINKSLLDAKASNNKQQTHDNDQQPARKKGSKEGLFKNSKRSRKYRNHRNNKRNGASDEALPVSKTNSEKRLADPSELKSSEQQHKGREQRGTNRGHGYSKDSKETDSRRSSLVQNSLVLTLNPDDSRQQFPSSQQARKKKTSTHLKKQNEDHQGRRGSISTSIGQGNLQDNNNIERLRRGSIQTNRSEQQQYVMQGTGNNGPNRQDAMRRPLKTKDRGNNSLGLGFTQSSNLSAANTQQYEGGEYSDQYDSENDEARLPVRMRAGSLSNKNNNRRGSLDNRRGSPTQRYTNKDGSSGFELPPVELSKRSQKVSGSGEILKSLNSGGSGKSLLSGVNSRSSSRSHSRCLEADAYDSSGNLISPSYHASYHDNSRNKNKSSPNINNQVRKRNIFFGGRFAYPKQSETSSEAAMVMNRDFLTPSPKVRQSFPQYDLMALRMSNKTSRMDFSYYRYPIQYKKHFESVKGKAETTGRRKVKSPKKKLK